jgi:ribonucleotide monophosphatase NagD (HAD superfamily)
MFTSRSSVKPAPLLTLDPQVSPTQVIQAHTVMQSLVQDFGDKPVLMIGGPEGVPGASRAVMEG